MMEIYKSHAMMEKYESYTREELVAKCEGLIKENDSLKSKLVVESNGIDSKTIHTSTSNNNLQQKTDDNAKQRNISDKQTNNNAQQNNKNAQQNNNNAQQNNNNAQQNNNSKPKQINVKKNQKPFEFSKYRVKRIALKILYFGWDYCGFAVQDNTDKTVEAEIMKAMLKSKLIEDRIGSKYSRCGRTDKGVSSFGQVIALDVRSNFLITEDPKNCGEKRELPYLKILNRVLPDDIRAYAYANVEPTFDARFDCISRTYKYYFPADNLNIQAMQEAATLLLGEHDFRNFCKVDVGNNVNHFIRRIDSFKIRGSPTSGKDVREICEMEITGMAFLWHQVRCMAAVLFLIGMNLEKPEIMKYLLDIEKCPKRPQYGMASEVPLVLYDCVYEGINWIYETGKNNDTTEMNINNLQQFWSTKTIQSKTALTMLDDLLSHTNAPILKNLTSTILPSFTGKKDHIVMEKRATCGGLDRHMERQAVKRVKLKEKWMAKKAKLESPS